MKTAKKEGPKKARKMSARHRLGTVACLGTLLAFVLSVTVMPDYLAFAYTPVAVYAILALSLVLVWGNGGIFSLGQAGLFALGAYTYGIVGINVSANTNETISALVAASLIGGLAALILGIFMFYGEISDIYVGVVTLAASLLMLTIVSSTTGPEYVIGEAHIGGFNGLIGIPPLMIRGTVLDSNSLFALTGVSALVIAVLLHWLRRRPFGRILAASVDNELRAQLLGYDVRRYRLAVFSLGGVIAGFGGGLYASWSLIATPSMFGLVPAAVVIIWVLLGGRSSVVGAFIGVGIIHYVTTVSATLGGSWPPMLQGVILIAVILLLPNGIVPSLFAALRKAWTPRTDAAAPETQIDGDGMHANLGPVIDLIRQGKPRAKAIHAHDVSKGFGGVAALSRVDISLNPGSALAVIGPNGAGKSTLFGLLSGRHAPSSGSVLLDGEDITGLKPHDRARLGIATKTQVPNVFPTLPVRENFWLALYAACGSQTLAEDRAESWIEHLAMHSEKDVPAGELAHGLQQVLEIALVMCSTPAVALLDEPTAGMTKREKGEIAALIKSLEGIVSIIVVDHDMDFLRQLSLDALVLAEGAEFARGPFSILRDDDRVLDLYIGRRGDNEVDH